MENHSNCEFCSELNEPSKDSSFSKIYSEILPKRIIAETTNFQVIPTMGQLFENSLLIISKKHIETLALLDEEQLKELTFLYSKLKKKLSFFGHVIGFEHGAYCKSGGGCGIYHAHLHILPLPTPVNLFLFFKNQYTKFDTLAKAFQKASEFDEYLLAINEDNSIGVANISNFTQEYCSQYFRKRLQKHFNLNASWNWRDYTVPEPMLINSLRNLTVENL